MWLNIRKHQVSVVNIVIKVRTFISQNDRSPIWPPAIDHLKCSQRQSQNNPQVSFCWWTWWVACFQTSTNPASDQKVSVRNTANKNMLNIQYWSALKQGTWFPVAVGAGRHVMWQTCDTYRKYLAVIVQVARLKTDVENKHQKTTTTWLTWVLCLRWDGNPSLAPRYPSETSHV